MGVSLCWVLIWRMVHCCAGEYMSAIPAPGKAEAGRWCLGNSVRPFQNQIKRAGGVVSGTVFA